MANQIDHSGSFVVSAELGAPLYQQIVDQVVARIESGIYPPGFRLPPTRNLAKELATHRNTVVRAYASLEEEGYVTSEVGRGTFVAGRSGSGSGPLWGALLSSAAKAEPLDRFERLQRSVAAADAVDLAQFQPSEDLLPHAWLRECIEEVLVRHAGAALTYAPRDGLGRLQELLATRLSARGVPATTGALVITTGSQQGLDLVARALIDPGDRLLVETATYSGALNVFTASGARVVGVPSDGDGPELAALDRLARPGAKMLYLMPNCHNPTGVTISAKRRQQILDIAHRHRVPVVEDDFLSELELEGETPPPAMRALDPDVIHIGTFSKKLIPALRVGYLVCPNALRPRLVALKHAMDLGTSALLQHALCELMERGYLDRHLKRARAEYRRRRDALEEGLARHLPPGLSWRHPVRGVSVWMPLPPALHPEGVFHEAHRAGVIVSPSTLSSVSGAAISGIRLTYCAEGPERLREGARRLGGALQQMMGRDPTPATPSLGVV